MAGALTYIAIVDDEESVRRALKRLIRAAGFEVESFGSGAEFLKSLPKHLPGCVVMDIHMPGMSGFEVQAVLKASNTHIPIILVTAFDDLEDEVRANAVGAIRFLRKPIQSEALFDGIGSAVGWGWQNFLKP